MADDQQSDKTENATPFKLNEARKKGQVAKSQELNHWIVLLTFTFILSGFWNDISLSLSNITREIILTGQYVIFDNLRLVEWASSIIFKLFQAIGPAMFFVVIAAVAVNILQTGPIFSGHSLKPDMSRLSPSKGFKKIFGRRILTELIKTMLKVSILIGIILQCTDYFSTHFYDLIFNTKTSLDNRMLRILTYILITFLFCLTPIVVFDFIATRREFSRKMKMSRRDVKDEHKRNDGSPEIKSKRRELQRQIAKKSASIGRVKEADLIITNPTHFAVALKYNRGKTGVPIVIAKGKGVMARKIREQARKYSKPILQRPPLARMLYKLCEIEQPIPIDSYQSVAEAYRWLYQFNKDLI